MALLCIAGKNRIAVSAAEYALDKGVATVVCPVGNDNGDEQFQPSLLKFALENKIRIMALDECQAHQGLVFVSLQYDKILSPYKFSARTLLNLHFSALPAYKGCHSSRYPILLGDDYTGVTLHEIDSGIDTGPIIDAIRFPIPRHFSAVDLYEEYQSRGFDLFKQNFARILEGSYEAVPQSSEGSTYFKCSPISDEDKEIDFRQTAEQVVNFVRSLYFPRYQTATFRGVRIAKAEATTVRSSSPPGSQVSRFRHEAVISTIDFNVALRFA
jgi:methionyl-tRNA formyltransferase